MLVCPDSNVSLCLLDETCELADFRSKKKVHQVQPHSGQRCPGLYLSSSRVEINIMCWGWRQTQTRHVVTMWTQQTLGAPALPDPGVWKRRLCAKALRSTMSEKPSRVNNSFARGYELEWSCWGEGKTPSCYPASSLRKEPGIVICQEKSIIPARWRSTNNGVLMRRADSYLPIGFEFLLICHESNSLKCHIWISAHW